MALSIWMKKTIFDRYIPYEGFNDMRCKSCSEDVPPKFSHAFTTNVCPLCGAEIMDAKLQSVLGQLKVALNDAKEYADQVSDWLFSNYALKKIAENEIVVDKNELNNKPIVFGQNKQPGGKGVSVNRNSDTDIVV